MDNLRAATEADVCHVATNLREADKAELAACGLDPAAFLPVLLRQLPTCEKLWCWDSEAGPVAIIGLTRHASRDLFHPWVLGTPEMDRRKRVIVQHGAGVLHRLAGCGRPLQLFKWAGNPVHLRWLERLGFTAGKPFRHPATGQPFVEITIP